jgi:hypothetical protein
VAGVGKTTVLKSLYRIYDGAGVRVLQVALAGRAAKRMQEATGRPAVTIACFLNAMRTPTSKRPEHCGFNLGDVLLCTRNMWDKALQNGSIGKVVRVEAPPVEASWGDVRRHRLG